MIFMASYSCLTVVLSPVSLSECKHVTTLVYKPIWRALGCTGKTETPNYKTCLNTCSVEFGFSQWHSLSSCVFEALGCFPSQSVSSLSAKPHLMTQWGLFILLGIFFFHAVKF